MYSNHPSYPPLPSHSPSPSSHPHSHSHSHSHHNAIPSVSNRSHSPSSVITASVPVNAYSVNTPSVQGALIPPSHRSHPHSHSNSHSYSHSQGGYSNIPNSNQSVVNAAIVSNNMSMNMPNNSYKASMNQAANPNYGYNNLMLNNNHLNMNNHAHVANSMNNSNNMNPSQMQNGPNNISNSNNPNNTDANLVQRVRLAMDRYSLNQIDVMRDSGVSNSVLCLWLQKKYKGDNSKVNERLAQWLRNLEEQEEINQMNNMNLNAIANNYNQMDSRNSFMGASNNYHSMERFQNGLSDFSKDFSSHHEMPSANPATASTGPKISAPIFMSSHSLASKQPPQHIIPIRIFIDMNGYIFEDYFLWNLKEKSISPKWFATSLVQDLNLPTAFEPIIVQQMKNQIKEYRDLEMSREKEFGELYGNEDDINNPMGNQTNGTKDKINEENMDESDNMSEKSGNDEISSVKSSKKHSRSEGLDGHSRSPSFETDNENEGTTFVGTSAKRRKKESKLLLINFDLTFDGVTLKDKLLWDASQYYSVPEDYSRAFCMDLGLGGDWAALLAYHIRKMLKQDEYAKKRIEELELERSKRKANKKPVEQTNSTQTTSTTRSSSETKDENETSKLKSQASVEKIEPSQSQNERKKESESDMMDIEHAGKEKEEEKADAVIAETGKPKETVKVEPNSTNEKPDESQMNENTKSTDAPTQQETIHVESDDSISTASTKTDQMQSEDDEKAHPSKEKSNENTDEAKKDDSMDVVKPKESTIQAKDNDKSIEPKQSENESKPLPPAVKTTPKVGVDPEDAKLAAEIAKWEKDLLQRVDYPKENELFRTPRQALTWGPCLSLCHDAPMSTTWTSMNDRESIEEDKVTTTSKVSPTESNHSHPNMNDRNASSSAPIIQTPSKGPAPLLSSTAIHKGTLSNHKPLFASSATNMNSSTIAPQSAGSIVPPMNMPMRSSNNNSNDRLMSLSTIATPIMSSAANKYSSIHSGPPLIAPGNPNLNSPSSAIPPNNIRVGNSAPSSSANLLLSNRPTSYSSNHSNQGLTHPPPSLYSSNANSLISNSSLTMMRPPLSSGYSGGNPNNQYDSIRPYSSGMNTSNSNRFAEENALNTLRSMQSKSPNPLLSSYPSSNPNNANNMNNPNNLVPLNHPSNNPSYMHRN